MRHRDCFPFAVAYKRTWATWRKRTKEQLKNFPINPRLPKQSWVFCSDEREDFMRNAAKLPARFGREKSFDVKLKPASPWRCYRDRMAKHSTEMSPKPTSL